MLKQHFAFLMLVAVAFLMLSFVVQYAFQFNELLMLTGGLLIQLVFMAICPITAAYLGRIYEAKNPFLLSELYGGITTYFWPILLVQILKLFMFFGGLMLMIVPGLFVAALFSLVEFYILFERKVISESFANSVKAVEGYRLALVAFVACFLLAYLFVFELQAALHIEGEVQSIAILMLSQVFWVFLNFSSYITFSFLYFRIKERGVDY